MYFSWSDGKQSSSTNMSSQSRLVITAEDEDFDPETLSHWRDEGFNVTYLPYLGNAKKYERQVHHLADPLALSEKYAIIG